MGVDVSFTGDWAIFTVPDPGWGRVASMWMTVDELLAAAEKAKQHRIDEAQRIEEQPWHEAICVPHPG